MFRCIRVNPHFAVGSGAIILSTLTLSDAVPGNQSEMRRGGMYGGNVLEVDFFVPGEQSDRSHPACQSQTRHLRLHALGHQRSVKCRERTRPRRVSRTDYRPTETNRPEMKRASVFPNQPSHTLRDDKPRRTLVVYPRSACCRIVYQEQELHQKCL